MKINLKTFSSLKDLLGFSEKEVLLPENSTAENALKRILGDTAVPENLIDSLLYAVNETYITPDTILHDNDTLAVFPPVSGG